jgi:hypothetical protein
MSQFQAGTLLRCVFLSLLPFCLLPEVHQVKVAEPAASRFAYITIMMVISTMVVVGAIGLTGCAQLSDTHREYAQRRAQGMILRSNMRSVQLAAMAYYNDHAHYPLAVDDQFKSYFPGGTPGKAATKQPFLNPYTSEIQWPLLGNRMDLQSLKSTAPPDLSPGIIEYSVFDSGKHFAIMGGDITGKSVASIEEPSKPLVLSDQ